MVAEFVVAAAIAFAIFALIVPIVPLQQNSPANAPSEPSVFLGSISRATIQIGLEIYEDGTMLFKL